LAKLILDNDPRELALNGDIHPFHIKNAMEFKQHIKKYETEKNRAGRESYPTSLFMPLNCIDSEDSGFLMDINWSVKKRHWFVYSTRPDYGKTWFAKSI